MFVCRCLGVVPSRAAARQRTATQHYRNMSLRDDDDDLEVGEREPLAGGHDSAEPPNPKCVSQQRGCAAGRPCLNDMGR